MNFNNIRVFQSPGNVFEFIFGIEPGNGNVLGEVLVVINAIIAIFFTVIYLYQVVLPLYAVFNKKRKFQNTDDNHNYIFLISARDEEVVIAQIINSIRNLNYPQEKIDIHVIADNCVDKTATIAAMLGVKVFERFDKVKTGKSYALNFYFEQQLKNDDHKHIGYIIADADNVFDKDYLFEINKAYVETRKDVISTYRASSNPGDSLAAYGSAYSFLRECTLMHRGRAVLDVSTYVSGTGFFMSRALVEEKKGWHHHLLIEDIEFSVNQVLNNQQIMYVHDAIFYDEQPKTMHASMRQRTRWVKGLYQCFAGYAPKLVKQLFTKKQSIKEKFSTFESLLFVTPLPTFMLVWFMLYGSISAINLAIGGTDLNYFLNTFVSTVFNFFVVFYLFTILMSYIITFSDWRRIKMHWLKKLVLPFFSVFYLLTYIPILLFTPFMNVKWKPVKHYGVKDTFQ